MNAIPRSALILGLAGLIPFLWGAATTLSPSLNQWGLTTFGPRFSGYFVGLQYGTIILAFMSGVLWGFATKATGRAATAGYILSVIPALWAFFMVGAGPVSSAINLIVGFLALLLLDWHFWKLELAPPWWMHLRVLLTAIVILSYLPLVL
ncbi:MAG: DUF3429 domain-containing protein [Pseudomonadota bacterium]